MLTPIIRALAGAAAFAAILLPAAAGSAQPTSASPLAPPPNSVRKVVPAQGWHALVGATVHVSPERTLDKATLVWRDGRIVSVEEQAPAPAGATVHDGAGLHVYAGFIEPYLEIDVPRPDLGAPGSHWNPRVTPERSALDKGARAVDARLAESLREMGFTAAAISPRGGIFRGQGSVISLARPSGDPSVAPPRIYREAAYQAVSFETSFGGAASEAPSDQAADTARWSAYPDSQMGAIALIRQTLSDADWQKSARRAGTLVEPRNALDALVGDGDQPAPMLLFDVSDSLEALRAVKIAKEFSRPVALLGSGREYQRLEAIVADGAPIVLPLSYPREPNVSTIGHANATELEDLMHWEQAPTNARRLDAAARAAGPEGSTRISLTTGKGESRMGRSGRGARRAATSGAASASDSREQFAERLATAIKHGLPPERALAMLTTNPARLLGVDKHLGTIEPGKVANLVVADGPLFMHKPDAPRRGDPGYIRPARVVEVWIDGQRNEVRPRPEIDIAGTYTVTLDPPLPPEVKIEFAISDEDPPEFTIIKKTTDGAGHEDSVEIRIRDLDRTGPGQSRFTFSFDHEPFGEKGVFQNAGLIERTAEGGVTMQGSVVRTSGRRMSWTATRTGPPPPRKPSLSGAWPMVYDNAPDANKTGQAMLVFDRGNLATVQLVPGVRVGGGDAGEGRRGPNAARVEKFEYDGAAIGYEFDQSQVLMPDGPLSGVARVEARVDWSASPPRMQGVVMTPAGDRLAWTATRRDRNPFVGEWRVTQAGGVPREMDAADGLIIRIGTGAAGGAGGDAGRGGSRDRERTTVKLTFLRPNQPPLEIAGEEVERSIGKLFFTHDLSRLGMEGHSRDEITVTWGKDGPAGDVLVGLSRLPDGQVHPYQAKRTDESLKSEGREAAAIAAIPESLPAPFGPYGLREQPAADRAVITNVTIWTCKDGTSDTVIKDGAVVISDGKLQYVGPMAGLPRLAEGFETIDGSGKFVAPGIIDCHSHTGISRGVNEAGQAVTAEVRIGDVTDPNDVSWYRQLAGGVTSVNNLHGSANAVGGQSMVNKIRWGASRPDDMHFERPIGGGPEGGAMPGIKFALGENPKQSNWGDRNTTRYPQTRMGVEMLIRDRFTAAREYLRDIKAGKARRDLELEALGEILEGKRLVHCHSYRQDEILMLCRVAEEFGFRIGTFQHILEGYKVADELVKWSGGGSAFSDWWGYKWEVFDAIPSAGPIMAEQGVIVSYNSDSDEMARRLNIEAGKAAKYSGKHGGKPIPPHEAFKFVTLNPAKQLQMHARTGSLEPGKDADLALWSGIPTSPTSRCEMTWVDGRRLFSLEQDAKQRQWIASERQRLVQKVLAAGQRRGGSGGGAGDDSAEGPDAIVVDTGGDTDDADVQVDQARRSGRRLLLLDSVRQADDWRASQYMNLLLRGLDPRWMRAGDCGCGMTGGEQ